VTSLGAVADQLRRIADQLPIAHLGEAVDRTEEASAIMAEACAGSANPDLAEAVGMFAAAHTEALDLLGRLLALRDTVLGLASALAPGLTSTEVLASPPRLPDRVEQVRSSLARGVDGAQAQGLWFGPDSDVTVLRSGDGDEWYDKAKAFVATLPPVFRPAARLATHIEVKLAMRMREEDRDHETVVIDRPVCGRQSFKQAERFTCDKMLRWFLSPGARLTVIEHDGTRITYTGEVRG